MKVEKMVQGTNYTRLVNGVACNCKNLKSLLDLGNQPLANDFVDSNEEFETYPLELMHCLSCSHSQISVSVNPSRLFREYSYVSSTSETLDNYFDVLANKILLEFGSSGKILDIGSNDGSILKGFKKICILYNIQWIQKKDKVTTIIIIKLIKRDFQSIMIKYYIS
jgi:hypothetical protein